MHFPVLIYFFVVSRHDRVPVSRLGARGFVPPHSKAESMQNPRRWSVRGVFKLPRLAMGEESSATDSGSRRTRARCGPPLLEKSIHEIRVFKNLSSYVRSLARFLVKRGGVKKFPSLNREGERPASEMHLFLADEKK